MGISLCLNDIFIRFIHEYLCDKYDKKIKEQYHIMQFGNGFGIGH